MKNKRNTGLRAGVYRESSNQKSTLFDLLASVLIFLALAAVFYTVSGFAAMLWLLGAGILTCIAAAVIRHFRKTKWMLPILLAALLLVVLFARNPLLNGFGAAWNTLRDLWAAEKGILLPLAETDSSGLWLAGIVAGILLALLALILVLQIHGVNVSSLVAGLGIIGAIVGLALQDMLKDVIMGMNILTGEYFAVGDVVKYGEVTGEVVQFTLRATKLRELATGNLVTVSNRNIFQVSQLSNELYLTVSTSYDDGPDAIEPFLQQLAREIAQLPDVESCTFLGLSKLGDWSVDYLLGLRAKPAVQNAVRRRALGHIRRRFLESGFTIPYPQMDVHTD